MERRFAQVDVFATGPLTGNPLAVVVDAEGLDDATMQAFARWTNLSETTFLLPPTNPEADYRVRIFTLQHELPFAGHPTLGSAGVWLAAGGRGRRPGRLVQECGAGLVDLRVHPDGLLSFGAPPLVRDGPVEDPLLDDLCALLGVGRGDVVDAAWVDNGPGWVGLLLRDEEVLAAVRPDVARWPRDVGVDVGVAALLGPGGGPDVALEVRAFFTDHRGQLLEDPVTGSLNASLAAWLTATGRLATPYRARQGTALGRDGRVHVTADEGGRPWIGGRVHHHVTGTLSLGAVAGPAGRPSD